MKIFAKRDRGYLEIPENFAILSEISKNGKFVYEITYRVDPVKAVQSNAFTVMIHISTKPYIKKINPVFANGKNSNENIVLNILQKKSKQKDYVRQQKTEYILSQKSDITSKIPNNLTGTLSNANTKQTIAIKNIKQLSPAPVEELNNSNLNLPVLEMNLNKIDANSNSTPTENTQFIKNQANYLLYEKNIDPANLYGLKTNTIVSAQKVIDGTIVNKPYYNQKLLQNNPGASTLVENFLNKTILTSQTELNGTDYLNILVNKQITYVEVTEKIEIPSTAITDNEFYVIFELQNAKTTLEIESVYVNHGNNLTTINIPTEPPSVIDLGANKPGKVSFLVKQEDENAVAINIYKKELKPTVVNTDSVYNFVGKIDLNKEKGYQRFEDVAASLHPIIYRFIPVNSNGILSAVFTSKVIKFDTSQISKNINKKRKQYFVGFNATINAQSIGIEINSVPSGPKILRILKRDKKILQKDFVQVGENFNIEGNTTNVIAYEDYDVKKDRIYEYICEVEYKDGTIEKSANNIIVEYSPITNNILSIELNDANVVESGQNFDAVFNIKWSYISNSFELVKKLLTEQNLISQFNQDIFENRENLNKLFSFGVTRTNVTTNQVDSFGIIDSLNFSDLKYGKPKGISPIKSGFEYRYTVTAYLRNPETLLPKLTRTVATSQNLSYSFRPSRWLQPVTLTAGNIVTERTLASNHAKNDFTFGRVVEIKSVTLSLADTLPSISDVKATRTKKDEVLIQWKVLGNIGKIDHFVIVLNILEMQTIIGKAHNITNSNYFQFLDKLTNGESGALTYSIIPIYFDYSPGTATKTNLVII